MNVAKTNFLMLVEGVGSSRTSPPLAEEGGHFWVAIPFMALHTKNPLPGFQALLGGWLTPSLVFFKRNTAASYDPGGSHKHSGGVFVT